VLSTSTFSAARRRPRLWKALKLCMSSASPSPRPRHRGRTPRSEIQPMVSASSSRSRQMENPAMVLPSRTTIQRAGSKPACGSSRSHPTIGSRRFRCCPSDRRRPRGMQQRARHRRCPTHESVEGGWERSAPTRFGGSQFTFVGRAIVVLSDSCASRAPTIVAIASKVTFLAAASAPVNV